MQRFVLSFTTLVVAAFAVSTTPSFATSTATGGSTGSNVPLTQMPLKGYPTPEEILKIEEEKRKAEAEKGIPNPFAPSIMPQQPQSNVKQVYRPTPDVSLKRQIQDPRIDDGYVQGLIQHRAR